MADLWGAAWARYVHAQAQYVQRRAQLRGTVVLYGLGLLSAVVAAWLGWRIVTVMALSAGALLAFDAWRVRRLRRAAAAERAALTAARTHRSTSHG